MSKQDKVWMDVPRRPDTEWLFEDMEDVEEILEEKQGKSASETKTGDLKI